MMNTKTYISILAVAIFTFSSCETFKDYITPSGNITTETKNISGYSGINASHAFNVYVNFSDSEESIEIEANENLHNYIVVEKSGNELVIKIKDNINIRSGAATLNAFITTKYLTGYKASGATDILLRNKLIESYVDIELSGASSFKGVVDVNNISSDISGASDLNLSGSANELRADASGASSVKSYELFVNNLNIELSGASNVQLSVNNQIDIEASGASSLQYKGDARINSKDLSGASSIKKVN